MPVETKVRRNSDTSLSYPHVVRSLIPFPGLRALRSAGSSRLVSPVKLSTVGSRAFPATAAQLWNSLPDGIVLADSLSTFRRQLKHYLFQQSYPDVVL